MQIVFKLTGTQNELMQEITNWQKERLNENISFLIEAIMFFPYFEGWVSAVVNYREAGDASTSGIRITAIT